MSTFFYSLGLYNSHQPGPSKSQSDLYQEGATWVRQGQCLWVTGVKLVRGDWGCLFLPLQSLCHYHPLELPADDAGMEECCVSGSRQHLSAQAGSGETREARCGIYPLPQTYVDKYYFLKKKGSYITPSFQISWASFHISWASFHISKYSFLIANKLGNPNFRMSMTMEAGIVYVNEIPWISTNWFSACKMPHALNRGS